MLALSGHCWQALLDRFKGTAREAQNALLFNMISRMQQDHPKEWRLCGQKVCRDCWLRAFEVGRARVRRLKNALVDGSRLPPKDGRCGGTTWLRPQPGKESVDKFLLRVWTFVAETLAEGDLYDKLELGVNPPKELGMPVPEDFLNEANLMKDPIAKVHNLEQKWIKNTTRHELYGDYTEWAHLHTDDVASYVTFCRTWGRLGALAPSECEISCSTPGALHVLSTLSSARRPSPTMPGVTSWQPTCSA